MKKKTSLQVTYTLDTVSAVEVWQQIQSFLEANGLLSAEYTLDERTLAAGRIAEFLEKRRIRHFGIGDDRIECDFGSLRGVGEHALLSIKAKVDIDWDSLVAACVDKDRLISAWVFDPEFSRWQNADTIDEFKFAGRRYEHLPTCTDPVFGDTKIDTSKNPGRRVIRQGFVEAIGSTMWLGKVFWDRTGTNKEAVVKTPWLDVSEPVLGCLRLRAYPACFDQSEGEQGILQRELRELLFGV